VRILLDTNVFLWFIMDDPRLTEASKKLFLDGGNKLLLSMASSWEIFIKLGTGKLRLSRNFPTKPLSGIMKPGVGNAELSRLRSNTDGISAARAGPAT
jgi:PIN domain nuclease of toxin-antitoxin system